MTTTALLMAARRGSCTVAHVGVNVGDAPPAAVAVVAVEELTLRCVILMLQRMRRRRRLQIAASVTMRMAPMRLTAVTPGTCPCCRQPWQLAPRLLVQHLPVSLNLLLGVPGYGCRVCLVASRLPEPPHWPPWPAHPPTPSLTTQCGSRRCVKRHPAPLVRVSVRRPPLRHRLSQPLQHIGAAMAASWPAPPHVGRLPTLDIRRPMPVACPICITTPSMWTRHLVLAVLMWSPRCCCPCARPRPAPCGDWWRCCHVMMCRNGPLPCGCAYCGRCACWWRRCHSLWRMPT